MSENEENRKKGRYDYLNRYKPREDGSYEYTGRYIACDEFAAKKKQFWILAVITAAAAIGSGCFPAAGMMNTAYILIPYAAEMIGIVFLVSRLIRLSTSGNPVTENIYDTAIARLPFFSGLAAAGALFMIGGYIVWIILHPGGFGLYDIGSILLQAVTAVCAVRFSRRFSRLDFPDVYR